MSPAKKKGLFQSVGQFMKEARSELKRVAWPTRRETIVFTTVVIVSVIVVAIGIWVVDSVVSQAIRMLIE